MTRARLQARTAAACFTALLLSGVAAPALAQAQAGPQSLPRDIPAIPAPTADRFPGVIRHEVDATDLDRKIVWVRQTIPVPAAGPMTLLYPKFLPGNHAPTGPIQLIAGLTVTGGGARIEWLRDTIDPYAFHIDVPAGVREIEVAFQWLTQPENSTWRVVMTPDVSNLQFEKAILYPAGYRHSGIMVQTSVKLPEGWRYGVALDTRSFENGLAVFEPIDLEMLADSPMFAGRNYRLVDLDPGGRTPVNLHIVGDTPESIAITDDQIAGFKRMVVQADLIFGTRPFDRYEFLLSLSNQLGGIGLEHHRSSENSVPANFFANWTAYHGARTLLPHEYAHSWNGKFRRPADQITPNLNTPVQNTLVWVYEGQTEYWGEVLATRAGLVTPEESIANIAGLAAFYENQAGREWRALQDTTNHNLLGYRTVTPWSSWMRGTGDYYREALLIWLDVDTKIRELTGDRRSMDDFARGFFGIQDGVWEAVPYTFDEVVAALNAVAPFDWAAFLRARLDAVGPDAVAPLEGLARAGWRLIYVDQPTEVEQYVNGSGGGDFQYSLGFNLQGARIVSVVWGSPAFEAGIGTGWSLVSVDGRPGNAANLAAAITAAKGGSEPISVVIRNGARERTVAFDWHGGLRYPRLERIPGTRDRLSEILAPRTR
ncbi:peptidase M61 [Brevundimonas sp.]|uniref:M61 family metallopeptidase n=1 Tax=Brevundimonas sp. TaxID=1871086 RepID=UPI0026203E5E|nr:peptidase M61 [Brevundimonas sp.]